MVNTKFVVPVPGTERSGHGEGGAPSASCIYKSAAKVEDLDPPSTLFDLFSRSCKKFPNNECEWVGLGVRLHARAPWV